MLDSPAWYSLAMKLDLEVIGHDLAQKMPSQFPPEKRHHVVGTKVESGVLAKTRHQLLQVRSPTE
jgi:hypothetical protein